MCPKSRQVYQRSSPCSKRLWWLLRAHGSWNLNPKIAWTWQLWVLKTSSGGFPICYLNINLFTFTLHCFVSWGVLTPQSWQNYLFGGGCAFSWLDAVTAQGSTSHTTTLAKQHGKMSCGVHKAFKHWSDLDCWKLTVILTAVSSGLDLKMPFTCSWRDWSFYRNRKIFCQ